MVNAEGRILTGLDAFGQLVYDLKFDGGLLVPPSAYNNRYQRPGYTSAYRQIAEKARKHAKHRAYVHDIATLENNTLLHNRDTMHYLLERHKQAVPEHKPERILAQEFSFNGAIMLKPVEADTLPGGPLRDFLFAPSADYGTEASPRYAYQVRYGGKYDDQDHYPPTVYTRAEGFYAAMKNGSPAERFGAVVQTASDVLNRWEEVTNYLQEKKLTFAEWKTALAYFDTAKFGLLQIFHAYSYLKTHNLLQGSAEDHDQLNEALRLTVADSVSAYFDTLDMHKPACQTPDRQVIHEAAVKVQQTLISLPAEAQKRANKAVRGIIEADHPYYNALYAELVADRLHSAGVSDVVLAGLHYGGSELPFIVSHYLRKKYPEIDHEMLSLHFSKYSKPLDSSVASESLHQVADRQLPLSNRTVLLLDDGIFSGESLYRTGLLATYMDANVLFSTESIGTSRRLGHMMAVGGADPDFIRHELPEIIRVSPFRKVDNLEAFHAQGSFNLVKARVKRLLAAEYPQEAAKLPEADPFARLRK